MPAVLLPEARVLTVIPASRAQVSAFVARVHRHHRPSVGDVFRLAVVDEAGTVRGVASVGRPVARVLQDGRTLEVTRVATDGARNACSLLYGAARRVAFGLGYARLLTYTLPEESGSSLRGAGWACEGEQGMSGSGWRSRGELRSEHMGGKVRWVALNPGAFDGEARWPAEDDGAQVALFAAVRVEGGERE